MTEIDSYIDELETLLKKEIDAYQTIYAGVNDATSMWQKVRKGYAVYPLNVFSIAFNKLGQVILEVEKVAYWPQMLSSGSPARIYPVGDDNYANVVIGKVGYKKVEIVLDKDDVPEWLKTGKLALLVRPDDRSFREMERALSDLRNKDNESIRKIFRVAYGIEKPNNNLEIYENENLNSSQNRAIQKILGTEPVVVVHGPPGTGKTTTLVNAVEALINKNKRILIATPSNASADHITKELLHYTKKVVRVGNISRIDDDLEKHTLSMLVQTSEEAKLIKDYQKEIDKALKRANSFKRNFGKDERLERKGQRDEVKLYQKQIKELEKYAFERILKENRVAIGTLIGLCRNEIKKQKWDIVIIDEAAQAFEPACWAVASFGNKLVLAGDHQQLPPTLMQEFPLEKPYATLQEKIAKNDPLVVSFLDTQYRMNETIKEFSNQKFYDGKLKSTNTIKDSESLIFIDTAGCGFEEELKDGSRLNYGEVNIIGKFLENQKYKSIGIISPYSQQVRFIKDSFPELKEKDIQTIDGFQGQERDCIIISLVRSNHEGSIGFLKDYRRMNVALTRAKNKLVVIGDSATIGQDKFYSDFLEYVEENGSYRSAWEWM